MTKRKRSKQRKDRSARRAERPGRSVEELERAFGRVEALIQEGRAQEAVDLLEPLAAANPRLPEVHYNLGYARTRAGDFWGALPAFERAAALSRDPDYWLPLALAYGQVGLRAHALDTFRQAQRYLPPAPTGGRSDAPTVDDVHAAVVRMERDVQGLIEQLGLPPDRVVQGLRHMEDAQQALHENNYRASIAANQQAIKLLGDWPPPHNNLSLALFYDGQPAQAIAVARRVLAGHPDNVQALSNAVQFLAWSGQREEAAGLGARLRSITPEDLDTRLKAAEAAAVLDDDRRVYELLEPLAAPREIRAGEPRLDDRAQLLLAVAEANLGKGAAQRRLRALLPRRPALKAWLEALRAGRPGPGWADRFPYFRVADMVSAERMEQLTALLGREDGMPPERFQRQVARFVESFPQVVLVAEKLIWEEMEPEAGTVLLAALGTPAAFAALRRFGLSQAGDDDQRMEALLQLSRAGQIPPDERVRLWHEGEWREVELRQYEISEPEPVYPPPVAQVLVAGLEAFEKEDYARAEERFQRMLQLEPRAKEAYNNLGSIYARRGEHERAQEMYRAALEIDPLYVFPRCNLALYLLGGDDLDAATEMLKPLADRTRFHPQEVAFYSYAQARIALARDDLDAAMNALEVAVKVLPDYELAKNLLARLKIAGSVRGFLGSWGEQQRKRDAAWRARLQRRLTQADPSLAQALPVLPGEALGGTAREVMRWGGWSGLRKAELIERLIEALTNPYALEGVVARLSDRERDALRQVLARGGHMPWQEFAAAYDNDLGVSRYWQWHEPKTLMGRLRMRALLVEATVDGELIVAVPRELRPLLEQALASAS